MHRSYWDLEVYAKDFQARRQEEAARGRLADEAARAARRRFTTNPFTMAVARLLSAWGAFLKPGRTAASVELDAAAAADVAFQPVRPGQGRLAQPYADMAVMARGPMAGVTEQPSGVSDC